MGEDYYSIERIQVKRQSEEEQKIADEVAQILNNKRVIRAILQEVK